METILDFERLAGEDPEELKPFCLDGLPQWKKKLFDIGIAPSWLTTATFDEAKKQLLFKDREAFYYVKNNYRSQLRVLLAGGLIKWEGYMVTDWEKYDE